MGSWWIGLGRGYRGEKGEGGGYGDAGILRVDEGGGEVSLGVVCIGMMLELCQVLHSYQHWYVY